MNTGINPCATHSECRWHSADDEGMDSENRILANHAQAMQPEGLPRRETAPHDTPETGNAAKTASPPRIRCANKRGEESTRLRLRGVTMLLGGSGHQRDASTALSVTLNLGMVERMPMVFDVAGGDKFVFIRGYKNNSWFLVPANLELPSHQSIRLSSSPVFERTMTDLREPPKRNVTFKTNCRHSMSNRPT